MKKGEAPLSLPVQTKACWRAPDKGISIANPAAVQRSRTRNRNRNMEIICRDRGGIYFLSTELALRIRIMPAAEILMPRTHGEGNEMKVHFPFRRRSCSSQRALSLAWLGVSTRRNYKIYNWNRKESLVKELSLVLLRQFTILY